MNKEEIIKILLEGDYKGFIGLHPKIWNSQFKLEETNIYPINVELNNKQIDLIKDIVSCTDSYVLVYRNPRTNNIQVFFSFHNGTNGIEGNIINSMRECLELIENINNHPDIEWVTVLDTYFDTCDDVYSWWVTFVIKED